jgi:two-component system, OmpR family, sensor histidine kinase VicK
MENIAPSIRDTTERGEKSDIPKIEVITDPDEIKKRFLSLVIAATREIQIVYPTQAAFRREEIIGVNDRLDDASRRKGVSVRILTPLDNDVREKISRHNWTINSESSGGTAHTPDSLIIREIDSPSSETKVTFVILDRLKSFIIELKDNSKVNFEEAIGLATYSDGRPTVLSYVSFFDKLWHESDLRKSESMARQQLTESLRREEKSSHQARLLQDIMAHDIVNYNQIIKLQAEMLEDLHTYDGPEFHDALKSIRAAVDSSTALLESARKLGKVLSNQNTRLFPKDLKESIENSVALIAKANPGKKIQHAASFKFTSTNYVFLTLADELVDDIFANLYSNSVKYTEGDTIEIETIINRSDNYWNVSILDKGRGIPDERKANLFNRYSANSKGGGLGLSIVHELVSRYAGKIQVENRIEGDYTKGTAFHVHLPSA